MKTKLQQDWKEVTLGEVAEFINGRAFKPEEWENKGKMIIRIQDLTNSSDSPNFTTKNFEQKYRVTRGDMLVSWSATLDAFIWNKEDGWLNQHIFKVKENKDIVDRKFLYYSIRRRIEDFKRQTHGSTMKHITKDKFTGIKLALPPLATQKKIVSLLDTVNQARELRAQSIELTKTFLRSVFVNTFLRDDSFPKRKLEECCLSKGEYGSGASAVEYDPSKPRYIRITDIDDSGNLREDSKASPSVVEEEYLLEDGDILFARSGATVGKTYLHRKQNSPAIFAGYLLRFKPNRKMILPEYLFHFTKSQYYATWVASQQKVVAQPNINAKQYGSGLLVPVPPIHLQQKFVRIFEEIEKIKLMQIQSKKDIDSLFDSVSQKVFKGDFQC